MAINFPDSPSTGQVFTVGERSWTWDGSAWTSNSVRDFTRVVSDTAPSSPIEGDEWFNSSNSKLYTYYDGYWIEIGTSVAGETGVVFSDTEPASTAVLWADTDDPGDAAIPAGGDSGQILQKQSDSNYNADWVNPPSHNYIINGAFDIWQRGTSAAIAGIATADRFGAVSDKVVTQSQQTFSPDELNVIGFGEAQFYYRMTSSAGGSYDIVDQPVEDVRTLAGQTVTLSFWAKADSSVTIQPAFQQVFGSGGSTSVNVFGTDLTITTSWQRFTQTFSIPSVSGKTIGAGSILRVRPIRVLDALAHTFDLWGVQLEAGSVATPFKRHAPSLQGELAACQRYYYRIDSTTSNAVALAIGSGQVNISNRANIQIPLPTTMRAKPTVSTPDLTKFVVTNSSLNPQSLSSLSANSARCSRSFVQVDCITNNNGLTPGNASMLEAEGLGAVLEFKAEL